MNVCVFVADFVADVVQILSQNCVLSVSFFVADFVPSWALVIRLSSWNVEAWAALWKPLWNPRWSFGDLAEVWEALGFCPGPGVSNSRSQTPPPLPGFEPGLGPPSWHWARPWTTPHLPPGAARPRTKSPPSILALSQASDHDPAFLAGMWGLGQAARNMIFWVRPLGP